MKVQKMNPQKVLSFLFSLKKIFEEKTDEWKKCERESDKKYNSANKMCAPFEPKKCQFRIETFLYKSKEVGEKE